MDVMAGVAAVKQAYELIKVIKESHDESVIRKAAGDLSEKITDLQLLNAELSGRYQAERETAVKLREEKAKIEAFAVNAENYDIFTMEGGSVVYRSKKTSESSAPHHYLCAHCYQEQTISILQPSTEKYRSAGFFVSYCPRCKNEFRMGKVPPMQDVHIPPTSTRRW